MVIKAVQHPNFQRLDVWNVAMDLAAAVYRYSSALPQDEKFGLVTQMRRSAVSIPSNIAEGQGRGARGEIRQFSRIAQGSLAELETPLLLAERVHGVQPGAEILELIARIRQMLMKLHASVSEESIDYD